MAYIGQKPGSNFRDVTIKDSFTGDGSTVVFDLSKSFNQAGQNDLEVFVDNVRQEPTTAYTVGQDGSGDFKRLTFTAAPAASASIYVLNQGETSGVLSVSDGSVTAAKIGNDAVSEEHLDVTSITGHPELAEAPADTDTFLVHDASASAIKKIANSNLVGSALITGKSEITIGNVASDDVILIFDTSAGVLKKITKSAFDALQPGFSSATPSNLLTGDGTGNYTIVIAGTDFDNTATFKLVTDGGTDIALDSVSRDSSVQLTGTVAKNKANLTNANEPFDVVITNGNGLSVTSANAINIDAQPAWVTSAGSLGTIANHSRSGYSVTVTATDPESGAINYALTTGALPGGLSLNTSTGVISGDADAVASNTTFSFTIEARDTASNATERDFSLIVQAPTSQSFTSSGTFSVPSGVSSVDVLVVAGGGSGGKSAPNSDGSGGGGAGGLIYRPGFTVTPGGTVTVTVGDGGGASSPDNPGQKGQDSVFGTLTAKGGGGGGKSTGSYSGDVASTGNMPGGSGGGAGVGGCAAVPDAPLPNPNVQTSQPGESGNYGFGNPGGGIGTPGNGPGGGGGGGGGAGAAGGNSGRSQDGGDGGVGKAYTIADGTTSVYYAGGGGGSAWNQQGGQGGQGGGGIGGTPGSGPGPNGTGQSGTANRGGGAGSAVRCGQVGSGGKGIVIVRY